MFHKANRDRFFERIAGGLAVLTAYDLLQLSGDMEAPFLQESSFWWLTGIEEPGWKVIIDGARKHVTLVRPKRSDVDVIFNGVVDDTDILLVSQADQVIAAKDFETHLRQLHRKHTIVYALKEQSGYEFVQNPAQRNLWGLLGRIFDSVQDCTKQLAELRAIKQPDEIVRLQKAIDVTAAAFREVHASLADYRSENQIEAEFTYRFRRAGAQHAYTPIVAGGGHACTLHYNANNAKIGARDLVLIDIGARVDGYSADITRTYCRNPTKRQREVHAAVERAHQQIIDLIQPNLLVSEYITKSDAIMKQALIDLRLLDDPNDIETYRRYFPHAVSHGLGVDTHDSLGGPRYFTPGMVLTVEPGIYIQDEGIGVRIEDDILVTADGHKNLSAGLPTSLEL